MIGTTIAYFATALASAALGYYWGRQDNGDEYTKGIEQGVRIHRNTLVLLNTTIRELEYENDQLRARLGDGSGEDIEDQYIEEEN